MAIDAGGDGIDSKGTVTVTGGVVTIGQIGLTRFINKAGLQPIGDNLYTSSVVALSAKTGEMKWYFQYTPHDVWDWDAEQPFVLVDRLWKGEQRKLLLTDTWNHWVRTVARAPGALSSVAWMKGLTRSGSSGCPCSRADSRPRRRRGATSGCPATTRRGTR